MFDQLFKRASTRVRYATAPFAEERARYLDYCEQRGDSRSQQLRKAHDLLWIARKLNSTVSYKSRATKYERWLSMASMMGTMVALISTCSRHASGSWDTLVHGFGISAISANQVCRFRSDHDCLNTATGRSSSAALPTAAFIIFAEQSGDFFVGMVQSDGSSPAFMPAILMPILLFGRGRGWARVTIHNVVAALRAFFRYGAQEGWGPRHLADTIQGPRIYAQERLPAGPRGQMWSGFLRDWMRIGPGRA
jgi:hypothetical protein